MDVTPKKFIVIPRDAFEILGSRHANIEIATAQACATCSESGQSFYVVELRAVVSRADRPVKVTKL